MNFLRNFDLKKIILLGSFILILFAIAATVYLSQGERGTLATIASEKL